MTRTDLKGKKYSAPSNAGSLSSPIKWLQAALPPS
ncbi:hypothetical protein FOPG_17249 [Fusarium oxysporum f. sp. conglutinans race 2 54008]|uniref:Uncharacterized protein n=1 Tax=Fusarium oxysporum f. sp. conglutinans race 2 54008 TaxID=1089457 RepID=X0GSH7_FUSOX|nr:hypothetical protein FOPG_17249 [Fusarium oxysporum f. sp. conglutinans race 2 54008]